MQQFPTMISLIITYTTAQSTVLFGFTCLNNWKTVLFGCICLTNNVLNVLFSFTCLNNLKICIIWLHLLNCVNRVNVLYQLAECSDHTRNLVIWSDLHFCTFQRIGRTHPRVPDDALPFRSLPSMYVSSIEVTVETGLKPPGTMPVLSTVKAVVAILVLVPGGESLTTEILPSVMPIRNAIALNKKR